MAEMSKDMAKSNGGFSCHHLILILSWIRVALARVLYDVVNL